MNQTEKISGVFSTQEILKVGTGTTTRKSIRKAFWFCAEIDSGERAGSIEVQPLNANYVPSGPKKAIDRERFLNEFAPEPEFYQSTVFPRMREITKTVARGERHRNNGELYSAEMEFNNALNLDVDNIRATFGLGLTYMARGENAKAENILERIVKMEDAFDQEYKHLYNEFGIQLRKGKMTQKAVAYYKRALELSSQDENIYYNMARAHLDNQEPAAALEFLCKALELNPGFVEASQFLLWLYNKKMLPEEKKQELAAVLKKAQETVAQATAPAAPASQPGDSAAGAESPPASNS
ncbi:MAG: tetratricopeptide repeat protein [Deltaproteobacteria bacterium]|jgi:tetratricopeptide (TPR) repeat protein|nr:tetratricopeptide repeat protein [Deltaproteobacteria bacterium]